MGEIAIGYKTVPMTPTKPARATGKRQPIKFIFNINIPLAGADYFDFNISVQK